MTERLHHLKTIEQRLLWLSPSDNLGARFLLEDIKAGKSWEAENGIDSGE